MKPKEFRSDFPMDVVSVQGKPYMFTNMRIDRDTIPEGFYAYDVRDDCDGEFWQIKKFVMVNHWGTIIGSEPVEMETFTQKDRNGNPVEIQEYWCEPEKGNENLSSEGAFIGETVASPEEFLEKIEELKEKAM